jgi:adenylosuccinate synthase
VQVQGATEVALTKLDSLSGLNTLKICTHYEFRGQKDENFPLTPCWMRPPRSMKKCPAGARTSPACAEFDKLPQAAQDYVVEIERLIGCHVRFVSVGPAREALILR